MSPARIQALLLALAAVGCALCWRTPAGAAIAVAALAALVGYEALRARAEWTAIEKLARDSAAALLKHDAQLKALERAVKLAVGGE